MSTLIFRTLAPLIAVVTLLFSLFILLRGHNEPGGGFIGGLIAAIAVTVYAMAFGIGTARRRLRVNPVVIAGFGVFLAGLSGLVSAAFGEPFLTAAWLPGHLFGTPGLFDIGVYLAVFGTLSAIALALEDEDPA